MSASQSGNAERVPYLDGWRGLAVLSVLIGHFVTERTLNTGRFGVEMFFVLSGRLMAGFLFVGEVPLRDFIVRRVARIYPAFLAAVIGLFLIGWIGLTPAATLAQALACIATLYNFLFAEIGRARVYDHIWSLCVELHTYVLLFGAAAVIRRYRLRPIPLLVSLAALEIACGVAMTMAGQDYYATYWQSYVRGASILIGAVVYLHVHYKAWAKRCPRWIPFVLALTAIALNTYHAPDPVKYTVGTIALAACLVTLPALPESVLRPLSWRPLRLIGLWSYSIYLWQQGFYALGDRTRWSILFIPAAIAAGWASYTVIETPARRAINRALHARKRRAAAAVLP